MIGKRTILGLAALLTVGIMAKSQTTEFSPQTIASVHHLTCPDGLSSQRVYSVLQDETGAIWISTRVGVDRYNGREIMNYGLFSDYTLADLAARALKLLIAPDGTLLAYDHTCRVFEYSPILNRFDLKEIFKEHFPGYNNLNCYLKLENGQELLGMSSGLYIRDGEDIEVLLPDVLVNNLMERPEGICIASDKGFIFLDYDQETQMEALSGKNVLTVCIGESPYILLVGTQNDGLWLLDLENHTERRLDDPAQPINPARSLLMLNDDVVAIGSDGKGVFTYNFKTDELKELINTDDNLGHVLMGNGIYAMAKDTEGNLWVGSYTGGVSEVMFGHSPSIHMQHEKGNPNTLANSNVNAVAENVDGLIWYGTDRGVSIERTPNWINVLNKCVVLDIVPDGTGNMWVGTFGDGIFYLNSQGQELKHLTHQKGDLTAPYVYAMRRGPQGHLFVGMIGGDLMELDAQGKLVATYPIPYVQTLEVIDAEHVAVSAGDGFFIVDLTTGEMAPYATAEELNDPNMSPLIVSMLPNDDGTIWLGTEAGGISLYDPATHSLIANKREEDGLPSDDVYSLVRDQDGRIWIGTAKGIATIRGDVIASMNYLDKAKAEYNKSAVTRMQSGDLIFGSNSGAVKINPQLTVDLRYRAPLHITNFGVGGVDAEKAEAIRYEIEKGLQNGHVVLEHNQNNFMVDYEAINLKFKDDLAYDFFLEGYDLLWTRRALTGHALYKNVPPGEYTLHLRCISQCNGRTIDTLKVKITIKEPWYTTWWAWTIFAIAAIVVIYFLGRLVDRRRKK